MLGGGQSKSKGINEGSQLLVVKNASFQFLLISIFSDSGALLVAGNSTFQAV